MNEETIVWWYEAFKLVVFIMIPVSFSIAIIGKLMERRKKAKQQDGEKLP